MIQEEQNFLRGTIQSILSSIFEDDYDNEIVTASIFDEVLQDIEETADEHFNDSDVRIAIARVLKKRLGIWES